MWEAACDVTTKFVIQVEEMKGFLAQVAGSSAKRLSSAMCDRIDRNTQIHAAEFVDSDSSARQETREESNNPQVFVPGSGTRDRPSKKKSIEGSFVMKSNGKKEKKKINRNIHVGLRMQLQEAEYMLGDGEDGDTPIEFSLPCCQETACWTLPWSFIFWFGYTEMPWL